MLKNFALIAFVVSLAVNAQQPAVMNRGVRVVRQQPEIGTFTNGRFHHSLTGTEFSLPADWNVSYQGQSSGNGEQIGLSYFGNSATPQIDAFVWFRPEKNAADEIPDMLRSAVDYKAGMREGTPGYKMLKSTIVKRTVGGQLALSVQAQFDQGSEKMIEYHTWATSEKAHVYISARMRAADFPTLQARVDKILDSFLVP